MKCMSMMLKKYYQFCTLTINETICGGVNIVIIHTEYKKNYECNIIYIHSEHASKS